MKKKVFVIICLLMATVGVRADEEQMLVVSFIDGSTLELALSETPHLSFPEDKVLITSSRLSAGYPLYRVLDLHFRNAFDVEGIKTIGSDAKQRLRIEYKTADELVIHGNLQGHTISLFNVDGRLLRTVLPVKSDELHINTSDLNTGVYVVTVNGVTSFKINVR